MRVPQAKIYRLGSLESLLPKRSIPSGTVRRQYIDLNASRLRLQAMKPGDWGAARAVTEWRSCS